MLPFRSSGWLGVVWETIRVLWVGWIMSYFVGWNWAVFREVNDKFSQRRIKKECSDAAGTCQSETRIFAIPQERKSTQTREFRNNIWPDSEITAFCFRRSASQCPPQCTKYETSVLDWYLGKLRNTSKNYIWIVGLELTSIGFEEKDERGRLKMHSKHLGDFRGVLYLGKKGRNFQFEVESQGIFWNLCN